MKPEALVLKYRRKGLLIDSNLLIGFLVGQLHPSHLRNCRATKAFTEEDFSLLKRFVSPFDRIVTTPHILTEVSNLGGRLPDNLSEDFRAVFRILINTATEERLPAKNIADNKGFLRFGLTDTAIAMTTPGSYLVLTVDLSLYVELLQRNVDVINFNHIRDWS